MSREPRIFQGSLSGRWYVATKWHERPDGELEADEKYDVTDQINAILARERAAAAKEVLQRVLEALELDNLRAQVGGVFSPIADEIERTIAALTKGETNGK